MIQVGDWVMQTPTLSGSGRQAQAEMVPTKGRVCYVHPAGRYCVVEFEGSRGLYRESYLLGERAAVATWQDIPRRERSPKCAARRKKSI